MAHEVFQLTDVLGPSRALNEEFSHSWWSLTSIILSPTILRLNVHVGLVVKASLNCRADRKFTTPCHIPYPVLEISTGNSLHLKAHRGTQSFVLDNITPYDLELWIWPRVWNLPATSNHGKSQLKPQVYSILYYSDWRSKGL